MSTNLAQLPLHALSARLKSRSISPVDIVATCLERIAKLDPKLHAFIEVYDKEARLAADAADKAIRSGHAVGPLHGIPIALKDLIEMEGRVATGGTAVWRERRCTRTATLAQKLISAGMIVIGKTHTVEFAFGGWGTNQHLGAPWNPWDAETHRTPGGSSSGSGVAVAARMVPCALGTDTGGSVRIPASWCGITGLKTTIGRISTYGVLPLSPTLDTPGPLTRSVEDAALLLAGDAGRRSARSAHAGAARCRSAAHLASRREGPAPGAHGCRRADRRSTRGARRLRPLGRSACEHGRGHRRSGPAPQLPRLWRCRRDASCPPRPTPCSAASSTTTTYPSTRRCAPACEPVPRFPRANISRCWPSASGLKGEFAAATEHIDALLAPVTITPAIPLDTVDQTTTPAFFTRWVNFLDLCALAVPNGLTPSGLPLSLQIVCRGGDEATALRIGWAWQSATDWHERIPALAQ
jgi:aspartyl-tRNA(Asn)/glutamyl-tRNA(Gln) amidotransferase subunit A